MAGWEAIGSWRAMDVHLLFLASRLQIGRNCIGDRSYS